MLRQTDLVSTSCQRYYNYRWLSGGDFHKPDWQSFISSWLTLPGFIRHYSTASAQSLWQWMQNNIANWQMKTHLGPAR